MYNSEHLWSTILKFSIGLWSHETFGFSLSPSSIFFESLDFFSFIFRRGNFYKENQAQVAEVSRLIYSNLSMYFQTCETFFLKGKIKYKLLDYHGLLTLNFYNFSFFRQAASKASSAGAATKESIYFRKKSATRTGWGWKEGKLFTDIKYYRYVSFLLCKYRGVTTVSCL